jgi:hypothetical protein
LTVRSAAIRRVELVESDENERKAERRYEEKWPESERPKKVTR